MGRRKVRKTGVVRVTQEQLLDRQEMYDLDYTDEEIATVEGSTPEAVAAWRIRRGLPDKAWLEDERLRQRLYWEGLNDRQIGEAVGVSHVAIHQWRARRGLPNMNKLNREQED